jgi:RNA recognition motif-containing protein
MAESLFVGNLPYDLSDDEFKEAFAQFGEIASVTIATRVVDGRRQSHGYGFVDFRDDDALQACLSSAAQIELKGRILMYRAARPRPQVVDTAFLSGIPAAAVDEDLLAFFEGFQPVEAKVVRGASADRPGFGYAKFRSQAERDRAIAAKNGKQLNGVAIVVREASRPFRSDEDQARYERHERHEHFGSRRY